MLWISFICTNVSNKTTPPAHTELKSQFFVYNGIYNLGKVSKKVILEVWWSYRLDKDKLYKMSDDYIKKLCTSISLTSNCKKTLVILLFVLLVLKNLERQKLPTLAQLIIVDAKVKTGTIQAGIFRPIRPEKQHLFLVKIPFIKCRLTGVHTRNHCNDIECRQKKH